MEGDDCRLYLLCMQTAKPLILVTLRERASPSHGSVQRGTPSTENSKNTDDHENTVRKPRWTPRESSASVFSVLPDQWHCVARRDILIMGSMPPPRLLHHVCARCQVRHVGACQKCHIGRMYTISTVEADEQCEVCGVSIKITANLGDDDEGHSATASNGK